MSGPRHGFPRDRRLTKASEFQHVFARATKSSDGYFTVLGRGNALDGPRLGLAISKRYLKRAVDRNRIKRLAREAFRHGQHELAGLDFVVMAKSAANQANNETLQRSLRQHWSRLLKQCEPSWLPSSSSTAI
ncbi:MAG: ribonuclease P protein component [Methylococcus sp.]